MKQNLRVTIATLLAHGASQHEIARRTGVDRKTVRRYAATSNSPMATGSASAVEQIPPPWPPASAEEERRVPAQASSACAPHRAWIETQVALGRNAVAIFQDLFIIVFFAFCESFASGAFALLTGSDLAVSAALCVGLHFVLLLLSSLVAVRVLKFSRPDTVAVTLCAAQKTLALCQQVLQAGRLGHLVADLVPKRADRLTERLADASQARWP